MYGGTAYDAVNGDNKRQKKRLDRRSPDNALKQQARDHLLSEARDLQRNFSLAAWAIRQHLDFVSSFTFHAKSENAAANERLEELMTWYQRPLNCDVRGMHDLGTLVRMAEERRVADGDCFVMKRNNGQLQVLEGDRIRSYPDQVADKDPWVHGVRVNRGGRPQAYAVHKRTVNGTFSYERTVSAANMFSIGYYDRIDQIRGVSPLASVANQLRDVYEGLDYALAKLKVSQMFAMVFHTEGEGLAQDEEDECQPLGNKYQDFNPGQGPIQLELDPGEQAKFLDTRHPSTEFQDFTSVMTGFILKALDIPQSFAYEDFSNYNGQRAALGRYLQSVNAKRVALRRLLDSITVWRINMWLVDGILDIPGVESPADLAWEWIPSARPWWNPVDEVSAALMEIDAGLGTRSDSCQMYKGRTFRDVLAELAQEQDMMQQAGVDDVRLTRFHSTTEVTE